MKKLLFAAMVAGLAVSAQAQTTFTQVWRVDTVNGGGPAWFAGDVARTVRSATHYAPGDKVLVLRRNAATAELRKLNPTTGAELGDSPQPLVDFTGITPATRKGTFVANMVDTDDAGIIYFSNLTVAVDRNTSEPWILYRMANDSATPAVAAELFPDTQVVPAEFARTRMGDTLQVVGSGAATEVYVAGAWGAGFTDAQDVRDLVKLTTTDGVNFSLAATYNLEDTVVPFGTISANRLGLAVLGTGANAEVWGDASGQNHIPRKWDLATAQASARLTTATMPMATGHTGLGLTQVGASKLLVSAPGAYTSSAAYGPSVFEFGHAMSAYMFDVTNAAAPVLVGQTEHLGLFAGTTAAPATSIWHTNPDGTSDVFFDSTRNNFGVVLVNNSITMHNFVPASVQDWNLF